MPKGITPEQYAVLLYEITSEAKAGEIDKAISEFLKMLNKQNALWMIDKIIKAFEQYDKKMSGICEVEIISAKPISKEVKEKIVKIFTKRANKIEIKEIVDPKLIGGMIIKSEDEMIDGSIKTRLLNLRKQLS